MLISLAILLASLLSSLLARRGDVSGTSGNPIVTPQDPSTLTLALIGAGTLAVYLTMSRKVRGRRKLRVISSGAGDRSAEVAAAPADDSVEQRPSRGAA